MFGRENHGRFAESLAVRQILPLKILTISHDINKESKHARIRQSFTCRKFLMSNSPKFSSAKHLHYMDTSYMVNCVM